MKSGWPNAEPDTDVEKNIKEKATEQWKSLKEYKTDTSKRGNRKSAMAGI